MTPTPTTTTTLKLTTFCLLQVRLPPPATALPSASSTAALPEWGTRQPKSQRVIIIISIQGTTGNVPARSRLATYPQKLQLRRLPRRSPPSLSLLALLPQRGSCCIFFSRIEFGMLSTQMRLCRRRPQVATAAAGAAVLAAAAAHVACHRRQPGSEPTKSCCYFRQQFQLHYTRLSCLPQLPLVAAT